MVAGTLVGIIDGALEQYSVDVFVRMVDGRNGGRFVGDNV